MDSPSSEQTPAQVKVTQEDRDRAQAYLDDPHHDVKWPNTRGIMNQHFASHREAAERRVVESDAMSKRVFLTCVSGVGPTPYLKVHFDNLADAHAAHDQLLGIDRGAE